MVVDMAKAIEQGVVEMVIELSGDIKELVP